MSSTLQEVKKQLKNHLNKRYDTVLYRNDKLFSLGLYSAIAVSADYETMKEHTI